MRAINQPNSAATSSSSGLNKGGSCRAGVKSEREACLPRKSGSFAP